MNFFLLGVFATTALLTHGLPALMKRDYNDFNRFGCNNSRCSMIISVLRSPRLIPTWTTKDEAFTKALNQMQAYQQLFSAANEEMSEVENITEDDGQDQPEAKMPATTSAQNSGGAETRSKRSLFTPIKVQRSAKEDNMYWLIRMPGK